MKFQLDAPFQPSGDQPEAIASLVKALKDGEKGSTLLGVTGSGKTFTMANVIQKTQRPTLIISHNKTLAAQLASEFREFFPKNAVHYFVSYYDYYQPEAYIARTDTYIEKETDINEEIERLRHASTEALMSRDDVIVVASVSCIYGIGRPEDYKSGSLEVSVKKGINRRELLIKLVEMNYSRNDVDLFRGAFRVRGEIVEVYPPSSERKALRFTFFGDDLERIQEVDSLTGELFNSFESTVIFPATLYISQTAYYGEALDKIRGDMETEVAAMKKEGKEYEAKRLEQRVKYDLEMIENTGYVNGIENYSRYFDGREPGEPSFTLIDYFPDDFLMFIDESHQTIPQIGGMYNGDRARKDELVKHGFRLQAAYDNRPLRFEEFEHKVNQVIYVSATPGDYEKEHSSVVAEQLIRPTGITEPKIDVRPVEGQVDDLVKEIEARVERGERTLVTTLTKRMAEELADFINEKGVKVQYLHSEVETMERIEILRDLRTGKYDVLVGINLLREGLDLPEVSLVAILDADKEGFLRSETSMIQVMGRAARHINGRVVMYADKVTGSMQRAMDEVNRRREVQEKYNKEHNITPKQVKKKISEDRLGGKKDIETAFGEEATAAIKQLRDEEYAFLLDELRAKMNLAAQNLEFEDAARLRDQIAMLEEGRPTGIFPTKKPRRTRPKR